MQRSCRGCKQPLAPDDPWLFVKGDFVYCCAGCAEGPACTCRRSAIGAPSSPLRSLLDRAIPLEAHLNDWLS
jgi:hypothetical protein